MTRFKLPLIILALCAVVAMGAGFASSKSSTSEPASALSVASALQNTYVNVYKKVSPSVVQIQTSAGLGSGIVFDSKGDIVTNAHVVGSATSFKVTTSNGSGKQLTGKLVGIYAPDDLAVIKVNGGGLKPAVFADSGKVRVGDIAMAIGNPLGLSSSVTEGIVSALGRSEPEGNGVTLPSAIQTSAPINPGNSGGALVDISGHVIGIPTLAATDPELGTAAAGIGFAIPSNVVTKIAGQLVSSGKVSNSGRAYLGIEAADTNASNGTYINQVVHGTPAAKAGLVAGELITSVDGQSTPTQSDLSSVLAGLKPGQTVTVRVTRADGTTGSVQLTLGQLPSGTA
jgi:S1-C subfamily serine protease